MNGTPFGRYRLIELLGRGGMGEVWRAFDPVTGRSVALKMLPQSYAGDKIFQQRFRREARAAAGLGEPHVVPIFDFGEIEGRFYVTMQLVHGRDLQALLEDGPLEPPRAVGIVEQIASALHAAHRIGLVHRDVKPSNILVAEDDFAYLIDFGIARAAEDTSLTGAGVPIGTWAYMAPERFREGTPDARVDVYALACVLYQSLTRQLPFPADSLEQIMAAHMFLAPPKPSKLHRAVPAKMDEVIATGMAKELDDRYPTTKDLAKAARAALTTAGGNARKVGGGTGLAGSGTLVLRYTARSDRGLVRANNDDSVYAGARLLAIADGMGGPAGSLASQLAIAALARLDDIDPADDILIKLELAVHDASEHIADHVKADPGLKGMGTTLTAILFAGDRLALAHVGGSRAYLRREGELTQMTRDQILTGPNVDDSRLTAPVRARLMRRLTGHELPTLKTLEVRADDRYLLCTDGLSGPVSQEKIRKALEIPDVDKTADRLIELALRAGGPDNITVVVADVVLYDYESRKTVRPDKARV